MDVRVDVAVVPVVVVLAAVVAGQRDVDPEGARVERVLRLPHAAERAADVEGGGRRRVDRHGVVVIALRRAVVGRARHGGEALAPVLGDVHGARVAEAEPCVDDHRVGRRERELDAARGRALRRGGQARRGGEGRPAVLGVVRARGVVGGQDAPRRDAGVDLDVDDLARLEERPRRAAVSGAVEPLPLRVRRLVARLAAALRAEDRGGVHRALGAVEDDARDGEAVELPAVDPREARAAVGGLEDPLAGVADVRRRLAGADVERAGRGRVQGDGAHRERGRRVHEGRPGDAAVGRLPHAADRVAGVERARVVRVHRERRRAARARAHVRGLQHALAGVERRGAERRPGGLGRRGGLARAAIAARPRELDEGVVRAGERAPRDLAPRQGPLPVPPGGARLDVGRGVLVLAAPVARLGGGSEARGGEERDDEEEGRAEAHWARLTHARDRRHPAGDLPSGVSIRGGPRHPAAARRSRCP